MAYQIEGGNEYNNIRIERKPKGQIGAQGRGQKVKYWLKVVWKIMFFLEYGHVAYQIKGKGE